MHYRFYFTGILYCTRKIRSVKPEVKKNKIKHPASRAPAVEHVQSGKAWKFKSTSPKACCRRLKKRRTRNLFSPTDFFYMESTERAWYF